MGSCVDFFILFFLGGKMPSGLKQNDEKKGYLPELRSMKRTMQNVRMNHGGFPLSRSSMTSMFERAVIF